MQCCQPRRAELPSPPTRPQPCPAALSLLLSEGEILSVAICQIRSAPPSLSTPLARRLLTTTSHFLEMHKLLGLVWSICYVDRYTCLVETISLRNVSFVNSRPRCHRVFRSASSRQPVRASESRVVGSSKS